MARKKKSKEKSKEKLSLFNVAKETRHWILGISSFVFSVIFLLAAIGNAGVIGSGIYKYFSLLFGIGYFLFPFILLLLAILFLKPSRSNFIPTSLTGSVLFIFSGLGIIGSVYEDGGGMVGSLISSPLIALFDIYVTLIFLGALSVIALLIIFDSPPSLAFIRRILFLSKKKETDSEEIIQNVEFQNTDNVDTEKALTEKEVPEEDSGVEQDGDEQSLSTHKDSDSDKKESKFGETFAKMFSLRGEKKDGSPTAIPSSLLKDYTPPPYSLLEKDSGKPGVGDIKANTNIIKRTLQNFGINVEMDEVSVGPSVTRYALKPAQGVKLSRIVGLQNDLSLALAAHPIRIEAPIPGKSLLGIEIPNSVRTTVGLASLFKESAFQDPNEPLLIALGRSVTGKPYFGHLSKMPHLLIAGATGSGKSVAIHAIIASLLYRNAPSNMRFILIDPKRVELTLYNNIPHLLTPVVTNAKKAILALKWAAQEMDRRYDILEAETVRDISSYHKNIVGPAYTSLEKEAEKETEKETHPDLPERMPYITIIIDELADIMSAYPRELESAIVRLAQMSRAVGIHIILSTQRPSVNIITGLIKANIPARMAFQVASQTDSRTILDGGGAEKLLGAGDMLYLSGEMSKPVRLQSAFVSEKEIKKVVSYLTKEYGDLSSDITFATSASDDKSSLFDSVEEDSREDGDELYEEAREIIIHTKKASTTFLQRKLRIGYARAARLMDLLEEQGVVGPQEGAKQREILVARDEEGYGNTEETSYHK